jgi:hypothetical protein
VGERCRSLRLDITLHNSSIRCTVLSRLLHSPEFKKVIAIITHSVCYIGCQSQWPHSLRCGNKASRLLGLWVWNPLGGGCGSLSLVSVVCCQAEFCATGRSLVRRDPTECSVCLSVIKEASGRGVIPRRKSIHDTENILHDKVPCAVGLNSRNICESRKKVIN